MRSEKKPAREETLHLALNVHLVRGHVYWSVTNHRPNRNVLIARGVLEDPYPAEANIRGSVLMEAAYAAYRLLG
jgi:hypothetical protein